MILLIRVVSPYTAPDRLLGAFRTDRDAARARRAYLGHVRWHDPWARQAYRSPSPRDVTMVRGTPEIALGNRVRRVFVVSEYEEGFGQISRVFKALCGALAEGRRFVNEVEAHSVRESRPAYCSIDQVEVGVLLSDV